MLYEVITRAVIDRFRGREITTLGDGFLALFDSAGKALWAAAAIGKLDPDEGGLDYGALFRNDFVVRITSYNVCYTKLLRIDPPVDITEAMSRQMKAERREPIGREQGRAPALDHVGEVVPGHVGADPGHLGFGLGLGPRLVEAQPAGLVVVTSYSIHYTKLYDAEVSACIGNTGANIVQVLHQRTFTTLPVQFVQVEFMRNNFV